jgi:hypothetical protein
MIYMTSSIRHYLTKYSWDNPFRENYTGAGSDSDSEDSDDEDYSREFYIHCCGGRIPVTKNLMGFLNSSNKPMGPIWIDAISINQDDVAERRLFLVQNQLRQVNGTQSCSSFQGPGSAESGWYRKWRFPIGCTSVAEANL